MADRKTSSKQSLLAAFSKAVKGNVAIMSAAMLPVFIASAGLAIDQGVVYLEKRAMQNRVDIAALTATRNLTNAESVAKQALVENGYAPPANFTDAAASGDKGHIQVVRGRYSADAAQAPHARFTPDATPFNAVRVTVVDQAGLYFMAGWADKPPLMATGTAYLENMASFSIGTRLASLDGGIANALLGSLLGTEVKLSVMDYNALMQAEIDVLQFTENLGRQIGVTAGTYDDVLRSNATPEDIFKALQASATTSNAKKALSLLSSAQEKFPLTSLFDLEDIGRKPLGSGGLDAKVTAMQILSASAALATGDHIAKVDLSAQFSKLVGLTAQLSIGEPPVGTSWFAFGPHGQTVHTAQTRLYLEAQIKASDLLTVRLPLYLELAHGRAQLASVSCPDNNPKKVRVGIDAKPGIGDIWIADIDMDSFANFDRSIAAHPASLVSAPLIKLSGKAHAAIENMNPARVEFTASDIANLNVKTVRTKNYATSLITSLIDDLEIQSGSLSLGPNAGTVTGLLKSTSQPLDRALHTLLGALGVGLGEADLRVHSAECGIPALVQ